MAKGEFKAKMDFGVRSPLTGKVYSWPKGHKFVIVDVFSNGDVEIADRTGDRSVITTADNFHEYMEKAWRYI